jgi:hypothetical protein
VVLQHELQLKAHEYEHEKKEEIRSGLVNIVSDSVTIVTFSVILIMRADGRQALTNTIGRISQGMSQTGKAFILILAADVLMGYHSEEGWTAGIEILSEHYMIEVGVRFCPSLQPCAEVLVAALKQQQSSCAFTLDLCSLLVCMGWYTSL